MPALRRLAHGLAFLLAVAASSPAGAQVGTGGTTGTGTGGTTGGGTLTASDFFIGIQQTPGANLTDFELARFFDKAACDCDTPVFIYVTLTASGFQKRAAIARTGNIEFWIGTQCDNPLFRPAQCLLLKSQLFAGFLNLGRDTVETNARVLSTDTTTGSSVDGGASGSFSNPNPTCTLSREQFTQKVWVFVDTNSDNQPDGQASRDVLIDLRGPPAPENVQVQGGNEALIVSWDAVESATNTDFIGYQILCQRGADLQVFNDGAFDSVFDTCSPGQGIEGLNPNYACSPQLSISTTSFRVKILQNEIPYGAAVASIDRHGNASLSEIAYGVPTRTKSFYDYYREDGDRPGGAAGGYCNVASAKPVGARDLAGSVVLLGLALGLAARRRSRR